MSVHDVCLSLPHILRERAAATPDRMAYRFLVDGTSENHVTWTYRDLSCRVGAATARLRGFGDSGSRVVLALRPGLWFVAGLLAILQAGMTVVPAFPPTHRRAAQRLRSIMADCSPDIVLTDVGRDRVDRFAAELPRTVPAPRWLFLSELESPADRAAVDLAPQVRDPAMVQYSSGSTGDPKGVVLTHANLVSNCRVIGERIGYEEERVGVSWLPPYHDMGLIGTIVLALYGGWPLVLMSPEHFVQRPYRWLRAITDHRATITVAPNFAFELCASGLTDDEVSTVDLSSLRQVFCGSEPISESTVDRFGARFGGRGYRDTALVPCYGLAEATLFVTGKPPGIATSVEWVDRAALEQGRAVSRPGNAPAVSVVGCGVVADGHDLRIVDPESLRCLPDGQVGEVWVHGPNVAAGYLGRPELTERTFAARLPEVSPGRDYLRTGDLGYLRGGELFVTGRISDLIVVAGRNLHPQDIERTVNGVHELLRRSVAFLVRAETTDDIVVLAEFRGVLDEVAERDLHSRVVAAVAADHGVRPAEVRFVRAGTIPTTTSGKIRRDAARSIYLGGRS